MFTYKKDCSMESSNCEAYLQPSILIFFRLILVHGKMFICPGTAARGFQLVSLFLLVKYVLKCGVGHTWRRTSASLNYERFHGHQVKFKLVGFTPSHSK